MNSIAFATTTKTANSLSSLVCRNEGTSTGRRHQVMTVLSGIDDADARGNSVYRTLAALGQRPVATSKLTKTSLPCGCEKLPENRHMEKLCQSHSALRWACVTGRSTDKVKQLCKTIDVNGYDTTGLTCLVRACLHGYVDIVKALVDEGNADVNLPSTNGSGFTPLLAAIEHARCGGRRDVIRFLIEKGADVDFISEVRCGFTALLSAAIRGLDDVVDILLRAGVDDVEQPDSCGRTPLILAVNSGVSLDQRRKTVKRLLKSGGGANFGKYNQLNQKKVRSFVSKFICPQVATYLERTDRNSLRSIKCLLD